MSKWLQFLLAGGVTGGKRLLSERTAAELFRPQAIVPEAQYPITRLVKPHWMTYGLGWFQLDYQGRAVDFHTGSIDGMVAIAGLIRDEKLGVYVLGNLDYAEVRHALMYTVFDRAAGKAGRDWSMEVKELYGGIRRQDAEGRKRTDSQRAAGTSSSFPLAALAGTYSDPLRGKSKSSSKATASESRTVQGLPGNWNTGISTRFAWSGRRDAGGTRWSTLQSAPPTVVPTVSR